MRVEARVVGQVVINPEEHLTFEHEVVRDTDLSGRRLVSFHSIGSRFERCRFERTRIESISFGAGVEVSEYVDCSFDGSRFKRVSGGYSRFVRCSFRDIDLRDYLYLPDPVPTIDRALALLAERPPDDLTPKVEFLLRDVLGRDLDQGQRQLFLRESDFGSRRAVPAHVSVAFDLLRNAMP